MTCAGAKTAVFSSVARRRIRLCMQRSYMSILEQEAS